MNPIRRAARPALLCTGLLAGALAMADGHTLADLATGDHRSPENIARNADRHPVETLTFFGLSPDMTVVEMSPGGGWYTEILAPYLRENGKLYTAHYDLNASSAYQRRSARNFVAKMAGEPDIYDRVEITTYPTDAKTANIGPAGDVDLVLVFRSLHGWVRDGIAEEAFATFYRTLKPGGVLGIVQHRAGPATPENPERITGYVKEDLVLEMAKKAGFELAARSDINANPRDTADYPDGVWTLPPSYRLGDQEREKYAAIGESDRMTLKFVKPGGAM